MAREIIIDIDTLVGYNFLLKKFYVENKGTITYRETNTLIKQVLDIVAPNNQVTLQQLQDLKETYETLNSLYYTWYENGSYIKTIQLNTYSKNPLVLDAHKKKLYIMNTNLIYDLALNEGKQYRVDYLISYYRNNIGLELTQEQMSKLYDLLLSYYDNQVVYNEIDLSKLNTNNLQELYYNTIYALTNYNENGKVVYACTENPNNKYSYSNVAGIIKTDQTLRTLYLQGVPNTTLVVGQEINLYNLKTTIDGVEYSADGNYTIEEIENTTIKVKEPFSFTYNFPYKQAYLINSTTSITSITRDNLTITLSENVPNTIEVGDIIQVSGTQQQVDNQTVSADGSYTVASISANKIVVQEQPPCNFTGNTASVFKRIYLGNITSISNNTLSLDKSNTIIGNPTVEIWEYDQTELDTSFTVASSTATTITSSTSLENYTPIYPQVRVNTPYEEILIDVTTSTLNNFPTGEFIVDNFTQCVAYINTCNTPQVTRVPVPASSNHSSISTQVPTTYSTTIKDSNNQYITMQLKGLYSKVYSGN